MSFSSEVGNVNDRVAKTGTRWLDGRFGAQTLFPAHTTQDTSRLAVFLFRSSELDSRPLRCRPTMSRTLHASASHGASTAPRPTASPDASTLATPPSAAPCWRGSVRMRAETNNPAQCRHVSSSSSARRPPASVARRPTPRTLHRERDNSGPSSEDPVHISAELPRWR